MFSRQRLSSSSPSRRLQLEALESRAVLSASTFTLHSNPTATKVIYLDFDGYTGSGTFWKNGGPITVPAYSLDPDPAFNAQELLNIERIFRGVAEDFRPFDVDVTTEEPSAEDLLDTGGGDTRWGIRAAIGGSEAGVLGAGGGGGRAYFGTFRSNSGTPALIFEDALNNGDVQSVTVATSHEVGHTLNLEHDGADDEYYEGHGSGATSWGTLMGSAYGRRLSHWSRGQFTGANNNQDDLAVITANNGFGFRADTAGDTVATAAALTSAAGAVSQSGIIERPADLDLFRFDTLAGTIDLTVVNDAFDPNLDLKVELLSSTGQVIAMSDPAGDADARISKTVAAGTYYLRVDGNGFGNPLATPPTGYTDYGSLGLFAITGTLPGSNSPPVLGGIGGLATYVENAPPIAIAPLATVADPDSSNFDGGRLTVTISGSPNASDHLHISHQGTAAGQVGVAGNQVSYGGVVVAALIHGVGATPLTVTFNANASAAAVQAVTRRVIFYGTGDNPSSAQRTVQFRLTDGDGSTSNTLSRNISFVAANDRPLLSIGAAVGYVLNAASYVQLAPTAMINDPDSANFAGGGFLVKVVAGNDAANRLTFAGGAFSLSGTQVRYNGIQIGTLTGSGVGVNQLSVLFNSNATKTIVQMLIRNVRFKTVGSSLAGQRTIAFALSDGDGGNSGTISKAVNVSG